MKLLVFSDSHRELSYMKDVVKREKPDYVFHLGDHDRDAELLERAFPLLPVVSVPGNCDGWSTEPKTRTVPLLGLRFFLCHGHTYGVKYDISTAIYAALEAQADVLLYGHTHIPYLEKENGIIVMNPGTCGGFGKPTYGFFELERGKLLDCGIRYC